MEPSQIERLNEVQRSALCQTDNEISYLETCISDYATLKKRLLTNTDQIKHNIMVPLGKHAFVPGELIHTNEVLVLLGNNYFADRSCKQAAEIVDRRITKLENQIIDVNKQKHLLEPRVDFTEEFSDIAKGNGFMQEICEEYNEEEEKLWEERHNQSVKRYRESIREKKTIEKPDDYYLRRLEELEQEELENDELEDISSQAKFSSLTEPIKPTTGILRKAEMSKESTDSEGSLCDDTTEPESVATPVIHFHHTKTDVDPKLEELKTEIVHNSSTMTPANIHLNNTRTTEVCNTMKAVEVQGVCDNRKVKKRQSLFKSGQIRK